MQRDISVYHTAFLPEENYRLSQLFSGFAISRALLYAISRVIHRSEEHTSELQTLDRI